VSCDCCEDARRDAYALVIAMTDGDEAGFAAIAGNRDLREVVCTLAEMAAVGFQLIAGSEARLTALLRERLAGEWGVRPSYTGTGWPPDA
jgi:hypothetical protein